MGYVHGTNSEQSSLSQKWYNSSPEYLFLSKLTLSLVWKYPKEYTLNSHSLFFSPLLSSLGSLSMGFLGLEWCDFPFRCLPIYRHLKEKTKRNNCSLRVARKPAQNMAGKLAPKGKEKREKGRLFPLWQTKPHGYGPQQISPSRPMPKRKEEDT